VQLGGFNSFSYADIARSVGVSKATIHHHFPTKADLGRRLIERYSDRFFRKLAELTTTTPSPVSRLRSYISVRTGLVRSQKLCLCGMLAAEHQTLTSEMKAELESFLRQNSDWVASTVAEAQTTGEAILNQDPAQLARLIIAGLDGLMILARSQSNVGTFEADAIELLSRMMVVHPSEKPAD
jgi:TetR/AcrR family transcriptional regulator, transcriptional repressor for nem operon